MLVSSCGFYEIFFLNIFNMWPNSCVFYPFYFESFISTYFLTVYICLVHSWPFLYCGNFYFYNLFNVSVLGFGDAKSVQIQCILCFSSMGCGHVHIVFHFRVTGSYTCLFHLFYFDCMITLDVLTAQKSTLKQV